jgi:hypothetical protein
VEELVRRHAPLHRRTSIHDGRESDAASGFLHIAPEADRLEQDAPWLAEVTQTVAPPTDGSSEADWIEQAQPIYRADDTDPFGTSLRNGFVPEADLAEQSASAYREPIEFDEG